MTGSPAPRSRLETLLRAERFVVTAEMQTSSGADPNEVRLSI